MKKVFNILASVALLAGVVGCEVVYDPIVIIPNPELSKTGMQTVNTISIYDTQETVINVARTAGLSKEMNIDVVVDEALVAEYNLMNGTAYDVLPSQYYTLPSEVVLLKDSLNVDFTVVTKPAAMVSGLGREDASDYVLPLRLSCPETGIDSKQDVITVMLRPMIEEPKVTVDVPATATSLDFISVVPLPQVVDLTAAANFNTLDISKIDFVAKGQAEVDAYNAANGTEYVLLASDKYKFTESFDAETMTYKSAVEFSCWTLDPANAYLLPIEATSTAYDVVQSKTIYVAVNMASLKVWISKTEMEVTKKQVNVDVEINTALPNDLEFDLVYDATLVDAYNTANSTSHGAFDAALLTIGKAKIVAGQKKGAAVIDVNMGAVPYDEGKFVAPLKIKADDLAEGTEVVETPIYLVAFNTVVGNYTKEDWKSSIYLVGRDVARYMGYYTNKYYVDLAVNLAASNEMPKDGQKYGTDYMYGMNVYYDIDFSKEIDPTSGVIADPTVSTQATFTEKVGSGCYAIINMIDRYAGWDPILANYSYFDSNTGEIFWTFDMQSSRGAEYHSARYFDRRGLNE